MSGGPRPTHAARLADDAKHVLQAATLIRLGARPQMLEIELSLPHERLVRLYREVRGVAPPKGLLPFSSDWYMTWKANIHASLFHNAYRFLRSDAKCARLDALVKAYEWYATRCDAAHCEPLLDLTRAWLLIRFVDGGVLSTARCIRCNAAFVTHRHDLRPNRVCVACRPPARAGKRTGCTKPQSCTGSAIGSNAHIAHEPIATRRSAQCR
ncbi:TPA: flagellar transcriptional regulator FlhC [Burkholderia territorii]|uniref:flagellar transcriptional regulator FlhC n=1 Tax=Burkholderia territorii TaxID=1503055 RepID=UPI0007595D6E|nr:flagellar transcriptional regulator FlhC [Burkholderia territorii]TXG05299.1 flagellar transcriptional regulator FlhC [Burkholderia territorii]HDR8856219.1 flagellar transcriptional regulator FlhC [Burkholderia territorii]HDR8862288.1 flagellar transcriptional regulator FlhC [Burkholderia territorii]HDR8868399.1 flagellar transcriptional regulator FlhC [Burkholderia territorii]HDR8874791.1 flagellar transcriptional regulator FlhC [Burkholderia territorii]